MNFVNGKAPRPFGDSWRTYEMTEPNVALT